MSPAVLETMLQKLYIMLVGNNVRGVFQTMCGTGDQTIVFKTKRETYTDAFQAISNPIFTNCRHIFIDFDNRQALLLLPANITM